MKFQLEWFTLGKEHLENQIVMDNVQTGIDTHFLRCHLRCIVVEVSRDSLWVGWQLNPLPLQAEQITLDLLVVILPYFLGTA